MKHPKKVRAFDDEAHAPPFGGMEYEMLHLADTAGAFLATDDTGTGKLFRTEGLRFRHWLNACLT
jgi:hypothetical protein